MGNLSSHQDLAKHMLRGESLRKNTLDTAFDSQLTSATSFEHMNINVGFLLSLIRMIDEFTVVELSRGKYNSESSYLEHLWRIDRSMMRLLSCKMVDEKKKTFRRRIHEAYVMLGQLTIGADAEYLDNKKAFDLETHIGTIFEDLVAHMEQRGMLTVKKDNPMEAMGKFSD